MSEDSGSSPGEGVLNSSSDSNKELSIIEESENGTSSESESSEGEEDEMDEEDASDDEEQDDEDEDEEDAEEEDDEDNIVTNICQTAVRNNLSKSNVKDIIKNLVSNDQVVAICKLRAEQIEKHIEEEKKIFTNQLLYDSPEGVKLTRKKAKELNHDISKTTLSLDHSTIEPDEEVKQLITEDLPDEEDDEEYNPDEDDEYHSDDYSTATCSDIESQPRTPGVALITTELDDALNQSVEYDNEGVFKVPGEPMTPNRPILQDETVARRTRSKVSLATTAIERIQETFVPPDLFAEIPVDPEQEVDVDQPWQEFLEQFKKPLDGEDKDEDEKNDPEYVASGKGADNANITVSKKEVQELFDELLEGFEESFNPDFANELEIEALKASLSALPLTSSSSALNAPAEETKANLLNDSALEDSRVGGQDVFEQSIIAETAEGMEGTTVIQPLVILNAAPTFSSDVNMVLGSDNRLYLVPSLSANIEPEIQPESEPVIVEETISEEPEREIELEISGWTQRRLRIYQRQLLEHIQLAGQLFIQTYSHPWFWKVARDYKEMLEDLLDRVEKESWPFLGYLCWNLREMTKICLDWEAELNVESEENEEYVKDLFPYKDKEAQCKRFFHYRVAELFLNHRAFIFESLLPRQIAGARPVNSQKGRNMTLNEMNLVAVSLHEANNGVLKRKEGYSEKAAHYFRKKFNGSMPVQRLKIVVVSRGQLSALANPIQAYTKRKILPVPEHKDLSLVCYDDVVPMVERSEKFLPLVWSRYLKSSDREARRLCPGDKTVLLTRKVYERLLRPAEDDLEVEVEEGVQEIVKDIVEPPKKRRKTNSMAREIPPEPPKIPIVKRRNSTTRQSYNRGEIEAFKRMIEKVRRRQNRTKSLDPVRRKKRLSSKFYQMLRRTEEEYDRNIRSLNGNSISTKIFYYLKEFDVFARLLFTRIQRSTEQGDDLYLEIGNRISSKDCTELMANGREHPRTKDAYFAWKYIAQVKEVLKLPKNRKIFREFLEILENVPMNSDFVAEFYVRLEELFLPNRPQLVEAFLVHLLPGHASQVGRFFHRLVNSNLRYLKRDLLSYMDTRHEQLRKIYELLNELSQSDGISMTEIKRQFLVVLDGNHLLSSWFLQLFPNQSADSEASDEIEEEENGNYCSEDEDQEFTPIIIQDEDIESPKKMIHKSPEEETPKKQEQPMWTREEDLIIFETVSGVDKCPEEVVLQSLIKTLPKRSLEEIKERFQVIVHLIQNLSR